MNSHKFFIVIFILIIFYKELLAGFDNTGGMNSFSGISEKIINTIKPQQFKTTN